MVVAAQKVEHYEIAGYGSACTFGRVLKYDDALKLLKPTLNEEVTTDKKLTEIAMRLNAKAQTADEATDRETSDADARRRRPHDVAFTFSAPGRVPRAGEAIRRSPSIAAPTPCLRTNRRVRRWGNARPGIRGCSQSAR